MCEYFLTNNNIWISIMIKKLQNPDFRAMNNEVNSAGEALSKADISFAHQVLDKLNKPLPKNKFDVGQWAICVPVSRSTSYSDASR